MPRFSLVGLTKRNQSRRTHRPHTEKLLLSPLVFWPPFALLVFACAPLLLLLLPRDVGGSVFCDFDGGLSTPDLQWSPTWRVV